MIADRLQSTWAGDVPAVVLGMPSEDYHGAEGISASGLKRVLRSPAHYRYGRDVNTRAQHMGTAIHTALLEPERYAEEYVELDVDDRRTKEAKEAEKQYGAERVLKASEAEHIRGMQRAVWAHSKAQRQLQARGWTEVSVFAEDPETGATVRCRPDLLTEQSVVLDLKKVRDARDRPMQRAVADYGYDLSAALYCDAVYWATGEQPAAYALLCVEEEPPHGVRLLVLDDAWMERGRRLYRQALYTYAECMATDSWPAYGDDLSVLEAPRWIERAEEDAA